MSTWNYSLAGIPRDGSPVLIKRKVSIRPSVEVGHWDPEQSMWAFAAGYLNCMDDGIECWQGIHIPGKHIPRSE